MGKVKAKGELVYCSIEEEFTCDETVCDDFACDENRFDGFPCDENRFDDFACDDGRLDDFACDDGRLDDFACDDGRLDDFATAGRFALTERSMTDSPLSFADLADDASLEAYVLASGYSTGGRFEGYDDIDNRGRYDRRGERTADSAADHIAAEGSTQSSAEAEEQLSIEIDYIRPALDDIINKISQVPTQTRDFLKSVGYSTTYQIKLYDVFREKTEETIRHNPYHALEIFPRMKFDTADGVAMKLGFEKTCSERVTACIFKLLGEAKGQGDLFVPKETLVCQAVNRLEIKRDVVEDVLANMNISDEQIQICRVAEADVVYEAAVWKSESYVARRLAEICSPDAALASTWRSLNFNIKMMEAGSGIKLSQEQLEAVQNCLISDVGGVSVVTGGPGTGKTTIIKAIIAIMEGKGLEVGLCAPTGRAAKRAAEASGHAAYTVHRMLEYGFSEVGQRMIFRRNARNPLDFDCVIVDEASMIDLALIDALCRAVKPGARLVLVGDVDQLPSVGAGNVLHDIIKSDYFVTSYLNEIHRQEEGSSIVVNAHRINRGSMPIFDEEFQLVSVNSEEEVLSTIIDIVKKTDADSVQVLTPTKKDLLGSPHLNKCLQTAINPETPERKQIESDGRVFREGDKVMQIKNNYQLEYRYIEGAEVSEGKGVFNGEVGVITSIDEGRKILTVVYDDEKFVEYHFSILEEIEHSYAITVHKSQGGEYPVVIIPIWSFSRPLMVKNLIYTAVTRAKSKVILVGQERFLRRMVENSQVKERNSGLCEKIKGLILPRGL